MPSLDTSLGWPHLPLHCHTLQGYLTFAMLHITSDTFPRCLPTMPHHDASPRCLTTMPHHDASPRCLTTMLQYYHTLHVWLSPSQVGALIPLEIGARFCTNQVTQLIRGPEQLVSDITRRLGYRMRSAGAGGLVLQVLRVLVLRVLELIPLTLDFAHPLPQALRIFQLSLPTSPQGCQIRRVTGKLIRGPGFTGLLVSSLEIGTRHCRP